VSAELTSTNVVRQGPSVSRASRWRALGQHGATVWFTGLPASGKSTLAGCMERRLVESGRSAYVLDGDNLRLGLCGDLGFDRSDREENIRRAGEVARLFADAGATALVALVSPYRSSRQRVREMHDRWELPFLEVFINTPLARCEERDPKGLYRRARAGLVDQLTGVDSPYEPPMRPDVEICPDMTVDAAADLVLEALAAVVRQVRPQT
jgi:adenylyl-sulfate kinase